MFKKVSKIDFLFLHSLGLLFCSIIDFLNHKILLTFVFGFIFFAVYIFKNWNGFTEIKNWGGFPNWITTLRLSLLFLIPFFNSNYSLAILSFIVLCLDGLDGFLARKLNQITTFGGLLDMEVDAFYCLLFSLLISVKYPELSWILIGGLLRYGYKIITFSVSKTEFIETQKKYARFIAGFYFLSFPIFFFLEYQYGFYIISIGTLLVLFSFTISFYEFFTFKK